MRTLCPSRNSKAVSLAALTPEQPLRVGATGEAAGRGEAGGTGPGEERGKKLGK